MWPWQCLYFNTFTCYNSFISMSVKDKIAMWNSMGSNNNNPINTSNPPKVVTTTSNLGFKPNPQPQEHMRASQNLNLKHQVEVPTIVRPSDAKKKAQMEQSQPIYPTYKVPQSASKPSQQAYKQPEPFKKETSNSGNQFEVESPSIAKPSDIKKNLEQKLAQNNFHIMAPATVRKVESITIQPKEETGEKASYEIERDVPTVNVKQSAQKLGLFYQKKTEQQIKPKEVAPTPPVHEQIHHQQPIPAPHQHQHHEQTHQQQVYVPPAEDIYVPSPPPPPPAETKEQPSQETDLALRLKNRNKKRRVNFDSDED